MFEFVVSVIFFRKEKKGEIWERKKVSFVDVIVVIWVFFFLM